MRKTTNYGLALYDATDKMIITANEDSLNHNMELIDNALKEKATIKDMTNYIEEHKEELKGDKGEQGEQGEKGQDGTNGVDGKDGTNGVDGYSPTATVTQTETGATITIADKNGTTTTNITNGKDGKDGKDGVDGAKGDTGDAGKDGTNGQDGYTPVKGTDYWTEADKTEIKEYVKDEIPRKVSELENDSGFLSEIELTQEQLDEIADKVVEAQKVEFVDSVAEMKDTSKRYVLPDGYIYTYTEKQCQLNTS